MCLPSAEDGTVIITSRMRNCQQYNTIGAVTVDSLTELELTELLLKSSGIHQIPSSSSSRQAEEVISILGSHTLAIIQAGAFIAAGHCRLDQYVELFQRHHQRMLQYGPQQAMSRYGNTWATFEAATTALPKGKCGTDALWLLGILSTLHASPVPIQIFEDAWKGSVRLQGFQKQGTPSGSTYLTQWHISQLPDLVGTAQVAGPSGFKVWDSFHLSEASHLLDSLALVIRNDLGLSMHLLVHAWAKDRQSSDQRAQAWLITGSIIALSSYESSLWHLHQLKLRPHLQSFLAIDIAAALSRGPEQSILGILLQCGRILLQMRDDSDLAELLNCVFQEVKADPMNPLPVLLPFHELFARNLLNLGRGAEAFELLERIVKIGETARPSDHPDQLSSQHGLAIAYRDQNRLQEASELEGEVMATRERVLGPEHPFTLTSKNNLALVLRDQGNYEKAEVMYQQILTVSEKVLGREHPDTLMFISNLASVLLYRGNYKQAEEMHRRVLAARDKVLGLDHPDTLTSVNNLALVLQDQEKYEAAEEMSRRALEGREKVLGAEHPDTLTSVSNLASVLQGQGMYKAAEEMSQRALEGREKVLGVDHPDTLTSVSNLALVLQYQGKYEAAEEMRRRALEGREKVLGVEHPDTLISIDDLALVLQYQGKYEAAEEMRRRALEGREKVLGVEHPDTLTSVSDLAWVLQYQGKYEAAEEMDRRALEGREKAAGARHWRFSTRGSIKRPRS